MNSLQRSSDYIKQLSVHYSVLELKPLSKASQIDLSFINKIFPDQEKQNSKLDLSSFLFKCTACKNTSRQTIQEITNNQNLEQIQKAHLNDSEKKQKFLQKWQFYQKRSIKGSLFHFDKVYQDIGSCTQDAWQDQIKKIFKK